MADLEAAPLAPTAKRFATSVVPFALAGVAAVGVVVDEIDRPHDNLHDASILAAGAVVGLVVALAVRRTITDEDAFARARRLAWDVVRFVLAFEMVRYGMAKLVGMQFYPQYWRLDERAIDMSPMALAWTFFGRSYGYQAIGGAIEVGSGVLVCFRRTTLLGACVMATALVNVVLINFFYDVPVKLFASLYLALDIALITRHAPRLRALFFPPLRERLTWHAPLLVQSLVITLAIALPTAEILHEATSYGVFHRDLLEGMWNVDRQAGLDDLLPDTPGPWSRIYFEKDDVGFVRIGTKRVRFDVHAEPAAHALRFSAFAGDRARVLEGTFHRNGDQLLFSGERAGKPFSIDLTREFPR